MTQATHWTIILWIEWSKFEHWPGSLCCVLGQGTLLSQCLSPPRSKWVLMNCQGNSTKMLGDYLRWTSFPSRGSSNTPSRFMLQKLELSAGTDEALGFSEPLDWNRLYNLTIFLILKFGTFSGYCPFTRCAVFNRSSYPPVQAPFNQLTGCSFQLWIYITRQ